MQLPKSAIGNQQSSINNPFSLHPYHMLAYHGNWYLLAHNEEKDRMATFALSRFQQVEGSGASFRRAPDFDAKAYAREAFGITRGEKNLRVRLLLESKLAVYIVHPHRLIRWRVLLAFGVSTTDGH